MPPEKKHDKISAEYEKLRRDHAIVNCIAVGIGGFFGSILRYLIGLIPVKSASGFPITTLVINVLGALAIGFIVSLFSKNASLDGRLLLLLKVGFCGGFTTFSTFSLEALSLLKNGNCIAGAAYIILSAALCIAAVFIGEQLVK